MTPREKPSSVFENHKEKLGEYEYLWGREPGRLLHAVELLTDAMTLLERHSLECRSPLDAKSPRLDLDLIRRNAGAAKELVTSVFDDLKGRKKKES